ncbi:histidinol-phosphatase [Rhabdobacter roseus]|uniref:Histidinol-phosphatase n=1 Tax=Rhabdobacter roseus TaxID=1655419 RepID=A0A840U2F4_9BACT|nr:histidinol-phosphatase [Rhabdobacter roseus]MBB5286538.1 histidinol-phosphatase (PHP family) [Rhabdobacter roseus]
MKPSFWTNYHSHSHYCDGREAPEAQVRAARQQGVRAFGFSSHGPVPFANAWSMKPERLEGYLAETRALQQKYQGDIELYVGLEVDYVPGLCGPGTYAHALDFTIGSVHYVDQNWEGQPWEIDGATEGFMKGLVEVHGGDIQKVLRRYYALIREMVEQDPPLIVGHLDKIKIHNLNESLYREQDDWYQAEIDHTLEVIAAAGCVLEVNTRGMYKRNLDTYPSATILKKVLARNIPVMLNADSHAPEEITARFAEAAGVLQAVGFRTLRVLLDGTWQEVPFDQKGLFL